MDNNMGRQAIRCNVKSCNYNNPTDCCCVLRSIQVSAKPGETSGQPDESMCSSYRAE